MTTVLQVFIQRVKSLTNLGLRRLAQTVWLVSALVLLVSVYAMMSHSLTESSVSVTLEVLPPANIAELTDEMSVERDMLNRLSTGDAITLEDLSTDDLLAAPYAAIATPLFKLHSHQGLSLLNVICTLITMLLVRRIGMRVWSARRASGELEELASGDILGHLENAADNDSTDSFAATESQRRSSIPTVQDDDWTQRPLALGLLGVVAMAVFVCNPIIYEEGVRPGPRPLAYLLATAALALSTRVLQGRQVPKFRCFLLIACSGLIHLPAALISLPVVLVTAFGGIMQVAKKATQSRLKASGRRILIAALITVAVPMGASLISHLNVVKSPLAEALNQYASPEFIAALAVLREYCSNIAGRIGSLMVNYSPQIAVISMLPLPRLSGVVERSLLIYGAALMVIFTMWFPSGEHARFYPVMVPVSILAAIGIVSALQLYLDDAVTEITRLWVKFFLVMAASPILGSALVEISEVPLQKIDLVGQRLTSHSTLWSPYTVGLVSVAALGLCWQLRKIYIKQPMPETKG
ncbi:MAG: hypothetical protein O3A00_03890 [Planctomycetota bacterium]|nr:hypothetical protein [Planctomycetota bacterium]